MGPETLNLIEKKLKNIPEPEKEEKKKKREDFLDVTLKKIGMKIHGTS